MHQINKRKIKINLIIARSLLTARHGLLEMFVRARLAALSNVENRFQENFKGVLLSYKKRHARLCRAVDHLIIKQLHLSDVDFYLSTQHCLTNNKHFITALHNALVLNESNKKNIKDSNKIKASIFS